MDVLIHGSFVYCSKIIQNLEHKIKHRRFVFLLLFVSSNITRY